MTWWVSALQHRLSSYSKQSTLHLIGALAVHLTWLLLLLKHRAAKTHIPESKVQ